MENISHYHVILAKARIYLMALPGFQLEFTPYSDTGLE
jgi:hypothetical protein